MAIKAAAGAMKSHRGQGGSYVGPRVLAARSPNVPAASPRDASKPGLEPAKLRPSSLGSPGARAPAPVRRVLVPRSSNAPTAQEPRPPSKGGEARIVSMQRQDVTLQRPAVGDDVGAPKAQASPRGRLALSPASEASTAAPEDDSDKSSGSVESPMGQAAARAALQPLAAPSLTPAPGAVIVFDWDDTLLPTSFVQSEAGREAASDPGLRQALKLHAALVERVLRAAASVAQVSIVTLSRRPWVFQSAERYLVDFDLERLVQELSITIYYANEHGPSVEPDAPCVAHYRVQKRNAIARSLTDWYATGLLGRARLNVCSVGDSFLEREALRELLSAWAHSGMLAASPLCKTLKLMDQPSLPQLGEELRELLRCLPRLAAASRGFDFNVTGPGQLAALAAGTGV